MFWRVLCWSIKLSLNFASVEVNLKKTIVRMQHRLCWSTVFHRLCTLMFLKNIKIYMYKS